MNYGLKMQQNTTNLLKNHQVFKDQPNYLIFLEFMNSIQLWKNCLKFKKKWKQICLDQFQIFVKLMMGVSKLLMKKNQL